MSKSYQDKNQSSSNQPKLRVERKHGGDNVEEITLASLVSVNDVSCKHEKLIPDPTETLGDAYLCANPDCAQVFIYDTLKP